MSSARPLDFFDKARSVAASALFACGLAAILGAMLNWVTIEPPGVVPPNEVARLEPFTGLEASDGWFVVAGGALMIASAALLVLRSKAGWAWLGFFSSMLVGAIAVANYRGLETLFYEEMDRIGEPTAGLGLTLVAAAGFIGLVAAAGGVAATPRQDG